MGSARCLMGWFINLSLDDLVWMVMSHEMACEPFTLGYDPKNHERLVKSDSKLKLMMELL